MGLGMTGKRAYNWYISMVAASCMVLYGYDASVFNALQGSKHWVAWFDNPVSVLFVARIIDQCADLSSTRTPKSLDLSTQPTL